MRDLGAYAYRLKRSRTHCLGLPPHRKIEVDLYGQIHWRTVPTSKWAIFKWRVAYRKAQLLDWLLGEPDEGKHE